MVVCRSVGQLRRAGMDGVTSASGRRHRVVAFFVVGRAVADGVASA